MEQNLFSTKAVDTSLDTISLYTVQRKVLLILWLICAYGMAMIWFMVLLCDRWEGPYNRRRVGLRIVLEAILLSSV